MHAWNAPQKAMYPTTGLGRKYRRLREEAEAKRVRVGTMFIKKYPEKVEETSRMFTIPKAEILRRLRKRRSPSESEAESEA